MTQDELLATLPSVFMGLPLKHNVSSGLRADGQVKWSLVRPAQTTCGTFEVTVSTAPFVANYLFEKRLVLSVEADSIEELESLMRGKLTLFAEKTLAFAKEDPPMTEEPRSCGDCGAMPGQYHEHGCDVERCARCGHQAIGCDCIYIINGLDPATMEFTHPEVYNEGPTEEMCARWDREWGSRRLRWTGFWPGSLEAAAMGLFCVWGPKQSPPGPAWGWVPCTKDTPGAGPDLNRLYSHCRWDPETQTWIARKERKTS